MSINKEKYRGILNEISQKNVVLVAVSKLQSIEAIKAMYDLGQRDFGENYVQELLEKQATLPHDIRWHFIGHLQRNKVKYIAPFVELIHGVDSLPLLKEINKQAKKINRAINCLLQVHIAQEETKFGMNEQELDEAMDAIKLNQGDFQHVVIKGLMGMASFSDDTQKVRMEMQELKRLFSRQNAKLKMQNEKAGAHNSLLTTHHSPLTILSLGMSGDYQLAIEEGSTMVRIGSLLFGERKSN